MNNTLVKGLRLLELMARSPAPLGITEVANRMRLGKGDVHRLMQSLVELGYARRVGTSGTYAASTKVWELGTAMLSSLDLRKIAGPRMERLAESVRETVHLSILDGSDVIYLHQIDSPEVIRTHVPVGSRVPAHTVATGKAILSTLDEDSLQTYGDMHLVQLTERTITDPQRFLREMRRVRETGYAINRGEFSESVFGVGAAIVDSSGSALAAIGVSGPADRLRPARFEALGGLLREAAEEISHELAGTRAAKRASRHGPRKTTRATESDAA